MLRVAEKCGVEVQELQSIIDKLKAKRINQLDDLAELTDDEWKEMGVDSKALLNQSKKVIKEMLEEERKLKL